MSATALEVSKQHLERYPKLHVGCFFSPHMVGSAYKTPTSAR